jgi:hypothetical protein
VGVPRTVSCKLKLRVSCWTAAEAANLFFCFVHIKFLEQRIEANRGVERKPHFLPENVGKRAGRETRPCRMNDEAGYFAFSEATRRAMRPSSGTVSSALNRQN